MSQELQHVMAEFVKTLQTGADAAGTIAQRELPLLLQEMLAYGAVSAAVWIGICLAGLVFTLVAARAVTRYEDFSSGCLVGVIIGGAPGVGLVMNIVVLIKIHFAPRLYLIEQIKELVN